jgi:integrase
MLHNIPKRDEYVFHCKSKSIGHTFEALRDRAAIKLQNPNLKKIHLHTFRHWKATMWQHDYRDTWIVKEQLGHKHLKSTEIYIHIDQMFSNYKDDKYISKVARNETEECQLIESGFEHVADRDELHFYRKRK